MLGVHLVQLSDMHPIQANIASVLEQVYQLYTEINVFLVELGLLGGDLNVLPFEAFHKP